MEQHVEGETCSGEATCSGETRDFKGYGMVIRICLGQILIKDGKVPHWADLPECYL